MSAESISTRRSRRTRRKQTNQKLEHKSVATLSYGTQRCTLSSSNLFEPFAPFALKTLIPLHANEVNTPRLTSASAQLPVPSASANAQCPTPNAYDPPDLSHHGAEPDSTGHAKPVVARRGARVPRKKRAKKCSTSVHTLWQPNQRLPDSPSTPARRGIDDSRLAEI